ncbi:MAG TPA: DUF1700 domain-containing protein [Candidatus Borkfalkia faecigallinarum]|uniref:DUF1700 domain-containing protein n=1 Tax=Candidatus Borkfalkia faecigallinarum TaxID=2838509 RepID=A0A9D2ARJ8_9FIRM|nr:DUF1700 domain-containing protein [Candidatus Borkfalkia faecigallinarum]
MTAKQWLKAFQKALAPLPRAERERAADYYAELFADRAEAGEAEETIARELGDPAAAARAVLCESGAGNANGGSGAGGAPRAGRAGWLKALLACGVGIPAVAAITALGCIAVALAASDAILVLAGLGGTGGAFVLLAAEGFAGGLLAIGGLMLAAAGVGCLLAPPLLALERLLLGLCGRIWKETANFVQGNGRDAR